MTLESLKVLAVILVSMASLVALLTTDWRASILLLAVQFIGVFLLVAQAWPLALAVTVLIAGWLSGAILGMAVLSLPRNIAIGKRINPVFNFLAAILIYLIVVSVAPQLQKFLPMMNYEQSLAALTLAGFGILRLALDSNPLSTTAALLSLLSGFEVIFASQTAALFAIGALAVITLFIALAGAYLLLAPFMEKTG